MSDIKRIDIKEFRENGYLQELNRRFLHPLGLALEIIQDEDGTEKLGGIWDYRNDEEGIYYDLANSDEERINNFIKNEQFVFDEMMKRSEKRTEMFGSNIEPIPVKKEN
jgi:hypothetical protein